MPERKVEAPAPLVDALLHGAGLRGPWRVVEVATPGRVNTSTVVETAVGAHFARALDSAATLPTRNPMANSNPGTTAASGRRLRARYAGSCATCGSGIDAGVHAWWDKDSRTLTCETCRAAVHSGAVAPPATDPLTTEIDRGRPGASAQREFERRKDRRAEKVRTKHPVLGELILAVTDEPQSTRAWAKGAEGERRLGARLDKLNGQGCVVLHDRRIPGTRANIDHLVVAPSGVWVIDAKRYAGQVTKKHVGSWFRPDVRLYVGRRDCTKLVGGMDRQVDAVGGALGEQAVGVDIHPVLCFVEAEWGLFASPFRLDGVLIAWPRATVTAIGGSGPLSPDRVEGVGQELARVLLPS